MKNLITTISVAAIAACGLNSAAVAQSNMSTTATDDYSIKSDTSKPVVSPYELPGVSSQEGGSFSLKFNNGIRLYPSLVVGTGHNSNLLSDSTGSLQSDYVSFAPKLLAELKHKGDRYTAQASLNSKSYSSSSVDSTHDTLVEFTGAHFFDTRARGNWTAGLANAVEARGANGRPMTAEAARYHTTYLNGTFIYGAPEAPGRVEFDLGNSDKVYDNTLTNVNDASTGSYAGRLFYRLGTKSLALAEVRGSKIGYPSGSILSSSESRYLVGLTWDATAKTTGIVKIGRMAKDFDNATTPGTSGGSWEATISWSPLTYSVVDFQSSRTMVETSGLGNFNIISNTDVKWSHQWSQQLSSTLSVGQMNTDFPGSAAGATPDRQDSAINLGFGLKYTVNRWLKVGVDLSSTDSTSNIVGSEFKRNTTMFTLEAAI